MPFRMYGSAGTLISVRSSKYVVYRISHLFLVNGIIVNVTGNVLKSWMRAWERG